MTRLQFKQVLIIFLTLMIIITTPEIAVLASNAPITSINVSDFNPSVSDNLKDPVMQFLADEYGEEQAPALYQTLQMQLVRRQQLFY